MEIGAQLYTLRDFCKTKDDLAETLRKIAEIGYRNVQVSGTCEYEADWLNSELKKNDLRCVITHIPTDKLTEDINKVANDHSVFGCDYIGLGYFGFEKGEESIDEFTNTFLSVANIVKEAGKYFMFHNHAGEFSKVGNKTVIEHLSERFSKDLMGFTLDTYWVQTAGGDPAHWIEKLKGRVHCIHLKDHDFERKMAVLGEGNINFDRVFKAADEAGTKYMLVEQDDCYGADPFDCLKRSYEYLKSRGFK